MCGHTRQTLIVCTPIWFKNILTFCTTFSTTSNFVPFFKNITFCKVTTYLFSGEYVNMHGNF